MFLFNYIADTKTYCMITLKRNLFAILLIIISTKAVAQSSYVKGYVILNNNDTLNGFLKQDVEGNLLKQVVFSNNENGNEGKTYTSTDIKAFYFNGGNFFESIYFTDVDTSHQTYFARYILKGYYNLYSFRKSDRQYFIIRHEDTTYLLYDDIILSSGTYDTKGNYQNQFMFLARNCSSSLSRIPQLRYDETEFINFTKKINDCVAPGNTNYTVAVKAKSKTNFYLYAGALPLGEKYEYTGRALVRISTPSISKNVALNAGVSYLAHKTTEEVSGVKKDNITNIVNAGLTIQNNFTTGVIQPYLEAGIGFSYKEETSAHTLHKTEHKYGVDFIVAAGIEGYITKKFAVKADWRYELLFHYPTIGIAYFF
jgi:hypothetical protein